MSTNKLPSQAEDFPAWYVEVVKRAELAEHGPAILWQEGHAAHATADEATAEALQMLEIYRQVSEDVLGDGACEAEISAKTKASIRFLPLEPEDPGAACMHCGKPGVDVATWARAY